MSTTLKVGDRVKVINKDEPRYDETGKIVKIDPPKSGWFCPFDVEFDNGDVDCFERSDIEAVPVKRKTPKGAQAYKGNGNHDWEYSAYQTYRLRVPGGWLYRNDRSNSVAFVPVPTVVGYAV